MAAIEPSRYDIIAYNGIPLLIGYLQQRPISWKQEAEVAACERVQQKAAIALTRLCKDAESAQTIVDLQGKYYTYLKLISNFKKTNEIIFILIHISQTSFLWDIGKQNSTGCDTAKHGVSSGVYSVC